jgi:hypothetical protein
MRRDAPRGTVALIKTDLSKFPLYLCVTIPIIFLNNIYKATVSLETTELQVVLRSFGIATL